MQITTQPKLLVFQNETRRQQNISRYPNMMQSLFYCVANIQSKKKEGSEVYLFKFSLWFHLVMKQVMS